MAQVEHEQDTASLGALSLSSSADVPDAQQSAMSILKLVLQRKSGDAPSVTYDLVQVRGREGDGGDFDPSPNLYDDMEEVYASHYHDPEAGATVQHSEAISVDSDPNDCPLMNESSRDSSSGSSELSSEGNNESSNESSSDDDDLAFMRAPPTQPTSRVRIDHAFQPICQNASLVDLLNDSSDDDGYESEEEEAESEQSYVPNVTDTQSYYEEQSDQATGRTGNGADEDTTESALVLRTPAAEQRGEEIRPKSSEQRLATIRRSKASVERYLEQSNLDYAQELLLMTKLSIHSAERHLSSKKQPSDSEE